MAAIKDHQAAAFLKSPDARYRAFLFYGGDAGLVSERASKLAGALAKSEQPPGEVMRLDDADLENEPDRLYLELGTIAMFGGRKIVRATAGRRINVVHLKPLVEGPPLEGVLIVEAGNLRADEALRKLFEQSDRAAAIGCYGDEGRDLDAVVTEVLKASGQSISADARQLLIARLGADRVLSRAEVEKLTLYAHGRREITAEDVEAIVGDASELAFDRILAAAASGQGPRAVAEFGRLVASGESAQAVILLAERHFHRLHRVRAALDKGRPFDEAIRSLRPGLFFKQKDAFAQQVRLWTADRLLRAITAIAAAAKAARLAGPLEEAHAERLLLSLAALAKAGTTAGR